VYKVQSPFYLYGFLEIDVTFNWDALYLGYSQIHSDTNKYIIYCIELCALIFITLCPVCSLSFDHTTIKAFILLVTCFYVTTCMYTNA